MSLLDFDAFARRTAEADAHDASAAYIPLQSPPVTVDCVGKPYEVLRSHIGTLQHETIVHFWTFGRYAMHHVLRWVLSQTGPADVVACTWAISSRAVEELLAMRKQGLLRSFRIWIDPRVKVRNPEPLQMLRANWPVAIAPVHAKVCVVGNDRWKVSISGSLNFTTNPQPECGEVCTVPSVYDTDLAILSEPFNNQADES